jgi:cytidine deaminase
MSLCRHVAFSPCRVLVVHDALLSFSFFGPRVRPPGVVRRFYDEPVNDEMATSEPATNAATPSNGATPAEIAELFEAARAVQANAHVPYSGFRVGAAVLTRSGRVFAGCNVENAAYPQGVCAEAGAISAMVAAGERQIEVVVTVCEGEALSTCCGGCRQKIREFATASTRVYACGPEGVRRAYSMAELLPDSFGPENLLEP